MFAQKLIGIFCWLSLITFNLHCVTTSSPLQNAVPAAQLTLHTATDAVTLQVEVANDAISRERGLMYRKTLEQDHGMLFIFTEEAPRSFWMKNTYLPLDLIFISSQHRVVGVVHQAEPMTSTPRYVPAPAQFVLEVNAGFAKRFGVGDTTDVTFVGLPSPKP